MVKNTDYLAFCVPLCIHKGHCFCIGSFCNTKLCLTSDYKILRIKATNMWFLSGSWSDTGGHLHRLDLTVEQGVKTACVINMCKFKNYEFTE